MKFMHTFPLFSSYYKPMIGLLQNQLERHSLKELLCIDLNLATKTYLSESCSRNNFNISRIHNSKSVILQRKSNL